MDAGLGVRTPVAPPSVDLSAKLRRVTVAFPALVTHQIADVPRINVRIGLLRPFATQGDAVCELYGFADTLAGHATDEIPPVLRAHTVMARDNDSIGLRPARKTGMAR